MRSYARRTRRTSTMRKRTYRRRTGMRKLRTWIPRPIIPAGYMQRPGQVQKVMRYCLPVTHTTQGLQTGIFGASHRLSELMGVNEFLTLYDQYRIDRAVITFSTMDAPTQISAGWFWWAIDYDDSTAISQDLMFQRADANFRTLNELRDKNVTVSYKPRCNVGVAFATNETTGQITSLNTRGWIDTAGNGANVVHNGIHFNVVNNGATAHTLYLTCRLYVSFRGIR